MAQDRFSTAVSSDPRGRADAGRYRSGVRREDRPLTPRIVARHPLESAGYSGNTVERVVLDDGRELVLKRVSPDWDWLSRATNDHGRVVAMWDGGVFERIPVGIDHATVAVETDGQGWSVFMRDVSAALLASSRRLGRDAVRHVLRAMAELHAVFWGERFPELCALEDRYLLLSPETARRELRRGHSFGHTLTKGWESFSEHVPKDVADPILKIVERPSLLAEQLHRCEPTLIHGDVRLTNLGFSEDRVVLIDWGERTGTAPAAVELASFLGFDGSRFEVSREDVIADFRMLYGDRFDEKALQLALIGGFVQLGCHFGLCLVYARDDDERAAARAEMTWWTKTAENALCVWSPV